MELEINRAKADATNIAENSFVNLVDEFDIDDVHCKQNLTYNFEVHGFHETC